MGKKGRLLGNYKATIIEQMNDIAIGKKPLNDRLAWGCKQNLKLLKQHGFTEE